MASFPFVVERVCVGGEVNVVERDGEAVCKIEPIGHRRSTVQDFVRLLRAVWRPDDEYLDTVEQVARNQPVAPETPWE
jgi:hypothetical protein